MPAKVFHADLWGKRETKYSRLLEADVKTTESAEVSPASPSYLFVPEKAELSAEYERRWKVTDIFPLNGVGMTTARDHVVIDFEREPILRRVRVFRDSTESDADLCRRLDIPMKKGWNIPNARRMIQAEKNLEKHIRPVLYRPFDVRLIFYHDSLVWRTARRVMSHMLAGDSIAACVGRAGQVVGAGEWNIVFCSRHVDDFNLFYRGGNVNLALWLYQSSDERTQTKLRDPSPWPAGKGGRRPNLNPEFVAEMEGRLGLKFIPDGLGDLNKALGPEDVFHYIYAIFHLPTYRKRYAEFLKRDFPRVPLTSNVSLFRELCQKGADLVALHLMEGDYGAASWNRAVPPRPSPFQNLITRYPVPGENLVEKVFYLAPGDPEPGTGKPLAAGRVCVSKDTPKEGRKGQYFEGVPPEVWEFHVGGYQVCEKWLKDRKGRKLSYDDIQHYHKIVVALNETIRLMSEIDAAIPCWPIG